MLISGSVSLGIFFLSSSHLAFYQRQWEARIPFITWSGNLFSYFTEFVRYINYSMLLQVTVLSNFLSLPSKCSLFSIFQQEFPHLHLSPHWQLTQDLLGFHCQVSKKIILAEALPALTTRDRDGTKWEKSVRLPTLYSLLFNPFSFHLYSFCGPSCFFLLPRPKANATCIKLLLLQHPVSGTTICSNNFLLCNKPP